MYYPYVCKPLQYDLNFPLSFSLEWSLNCDGGFNIYDAIKAFSPLLATDSNIISAQEGRPVQQGQVCSFDGVDDYISAAHLVGTETVASSWGVTPTVSAGRIDFPVGNAANVLLSDGTLYNLNHASGTVAYDSSGNGNDGTLMNGASFVADATLPAAQDKLNLEGFGEGYSIATITNDLTTSTISFTIKTTDDQCALLNDSGVKLMVAIHDGSASPALIDCTSISIDGSTALTSPTRDDLHTLICDGVPHSVVIAGMNTSAWTNLMLGSYNSSEAAWLFDGVISNMSIDGTPITPIEVTAEVLLPRDESDITKDVLGNDLQWSGSAYAHDFLRTQSYAGEFDGVDDKITSSHLIGTETVVFFEGNTVSTVAAGEITFAAGTCSGLLLSDGTLYNFTEGVGNTVHDSSGNNNHGTIVNASTATEGAGFWGGRIDGDSNAHNLNYGFSLYENGGNALRVPYISGSPISSPIYSLGYTLTSENPAIPEWHNGAETLLGLETAIDGNEPPAVDQATLPVTYAFGDSSTTTFQYATDANGNTGKFLALDSTPTAAEQIVIDKYHS